MRNKIFILWAIGAIIVMLFLGCYKGEPNETGPPFVHIYNNPPDSSIMGAAPIIWWWGTDLDGVVEKYQWIDIVTYKLEHSLVSSYYNNELPIPDTIITEDEADTFAWETTTASADTIYLLREPGDTMTEHLFCVRSIDIHSDTSQPECKIYYRTNVPPDSLIIKENEDYVEGDTFWVLNDTTWDWTGIPIDWTAHDPDNSVILEFYWWVENFDNPSQIVRTSKADDSVLTVYSGKSTTDGWTRLKKTTLKGEIPTGHWRFIIQVRDDAFEVGVHDTFEFYATHPDFDPSVDSVVQSMADTTYPHKLLVIFAAPSAIWDDDIGEFYYQIFNTLQSEGYFTEFDTSRAVTVGEYMELTAFDLVDYSIVYLFNLGIASGAPNFSPSKQMLEKFQDYALAGGRVIFDGRQFFNNISGFVSESEINPFGQIPFDIFGIVARSNMGAWIESEPLSQVADIYPQLLIDSVKTPGGQLSGVRTVGIYPYFAGIPYAEPIYIGSQGTLPDSLVPETMINNIIGRHLGIRYAKPNTRSALFSFPLYYACLLYTSPSPRDLSTSRMPSSA